MKKLLRIEQVAEKLGLAKDALEKCLIQGLKPFQSGNFVSKYKFCKLRS